MRYFKTKINGVYKKGICAYLCFLMIMTPIFVHAADPNPSLKDKTFQQVITEFILKATGYILTLIISLTVFMFLYGLAKYMFKGQGSDTARSEGRKLMLWGVIGIFVMTSVWGLVGIFASTIGHTSSFIPQFTSAPVNH